MLALPRQRPTSYPLSPCLASTRTSIEAAARTRADLRRPSRGARAPARPLVLATG